MPLLFEVFLLKSPDIYVMLIFFNKKIKEVVFCTMCKKSTYNITVLFPSV